MRGSKPILACCVVLGLLCGGMALPLLASEADATCDFTVVASASGGFGTWSVTQVDRAAQIVAAGQTLDVPERGMIIGLAVAMRESSLRNLANSNVPSSLDIDINNDGVGGDHDSVGLFQQRPSPPEGEGAWGTVAELMDPTISATKFFNTLLDVDGWEDMELTVAAQKVQVSAYPDAYAEWEDDATQLLDHVIDQDMSNTECVIDGDGIELDAAALPSGFSLPADTNFGILVAVGWALDQLGTPYSFGGDCTDADSGDPAHECDCSSLVQQAYAAAGITIPRITTDQVRAGSAVSLANIAPGDLVFIPGSEGTSNSPRHVGMYIGQGYIAQAPHTGDVVKITNLADWEDDIAAIRRIVQ